MLKVEEIKRLAALARLAVSEEESVSLGQDLAKILAYVERLNEFQLPEVDNNDSNSLTLNKMRADGEPHSSGIYTDVLTEQFSATRKGYLEVKPILPYDKE